MPQHQSQHQRQRRIQHPPHVVAPRWPTPTPSAATPTTAAAVQPSHAPAVAGNVPLATDPNTGQLVESTAPAVISGAMIAVDPRLTNPNLSETGVAFAEQVDVHTLMWDCTPPQIVAGILFWWHPTREIWLWFDEAEEQWYVVE